MKKILLLSAFIVGIIGNSQTIIYDTTHDAVNGTEITGTVNGAATSYGDAIKLAAGSERLLETITVDLFCLTDTSDFTVTMSLYTDCPTVVGVGACGSGVGTLIPGSTITVDVTPPATPGTGFTVDFPYAGLDISSETDDTITVMINASRNNVFWTINETPVIGSLPDGDTALSTLTRCGSVGTNNGCGRVFAAPTNNNLAITITATALSVSEQLSKSFSVFPNPSSNVVSITNSKNSKINSISITDLNGRVVKNILFDSINDVQVIVSDLSSGVYMMKINTDQGVATKKIIKQ